MEKTCTICNMVLANSKSLKLHTKNVHQKLKPYVCQVCNHGSATKHMMQVHMRQHTGEKPFHCDVPDCNFKTGCIQCFFPVIIKIYYFTHYRRP